MSQKANRLIEEPSPYLQQHAYNPVDWYPWGEAAFAKAQKEGKPILLSIGYAACHWCHVMAHESFEDESAAKLMNELFVSIKVDKEERPDLDKIYQTSHYLLSQQSGGWPLTVFLTPDKIPFYSGTYFPKEEHPQLPAFKRVLEEIASFYHKHPDKIQNQVLQVQKVLGQQELEKIKQKISHEPLELGLNTLGERYDSIYGGFGQAPKFPQVSRLEYLLANNSQLAFASLMHIAKGGIYDQLSGGFYRYSVDERWNIPHFEKMLYDNGQLLMLYAQAGKAYSEPYFKEIARETAEWVIKDLQAAKGGFYSSFDADSEGVEGKFYRWQPAEISKLLSKDEFAVVNFYYGLDNEPNFEGYWHFYVAQSMDFVCKLLNIQQEDAERLLASAKKKLLKERNKRAAPFRDEKILTSWNSLMIKGLLIAGANLKEPRFIAAGQKALDFIQQNLWQENQLLASYKEGKAYLGAYLDDYAFLLDSLLTSLQVSWNSEHLSFAIILADKILDSFAAESGGFFFTAEHHEKLLYRPKAMMDEATPSGNGILLRAFLILGHLLGESRYLNAAEQTLQSAWPMLMQHPAEHCSILLGLKEYLMPSPMFVIRGDKDEIKLWQEDIQSLSNYSFAIPAEALNLPESLALKKPQGKACAYLCRGMQCEDVISSREDLP
ncbi:MAG: thioredoxin domain-containing protein [Tatlockia sp.]|nr:thioredoxin domain-containing protein [Tatlockia sp.]